MNRGEQPARRRLYTRDQGGRRRYYGDFRDYADVGGGREALCPPGLRVAVTSRRVAEELVRQRLVELDERRVRRVAGRPEPVGLEAAASAHLVKKAQAGKVTDQALAASELQLKRAIAHFGAERELASIDVAAIGGWIAALRADGFGSSTIRHHLNSLSNLYRRAASENVVSLGYNPVTAYPDKPSDPRREARWLEVDEAALLLAAARTYRADCTWFAVPFAYELVATWLLTGGRPREVTGLEVDDVTLEREAVTFRPNRHRRLKTLGSGRTVPLWPQLAEILKPYFPRREQLGAGTLLFPSFRTGEETVLQHPHRILKAIAKRIGHATGITPYTLRHTYCAARLQTLDHGEPVSPFTVGRELGHGGDALVRKVYGHLGRVRHRSAAVEYRVEQHSATLRERLAALEQRELDLGV